jgi:transcriptional regulator with XRE-family HTH domain
MSIGGTLAEARHEAGLTVADVSARTRIRQALIRDIEHDEFASCGGDFYARGHIRAIAGVVGADPRPLISEYDDEHCPGGPVPQPTVRPAPRASRANRAGLDDLLMPEPPQMPPAPPAPRMSPAPPSPRGPRGPRGPSAPDGRSRRGWLVPVIMLAVIVGVVTLAYRLTGGKGGSQPTAATSSNRASARPATASPGQRPSPGNARGSGKATPPPATNAFPVTQVAPVSAAAVGPAGTSDGDNAQSASLALSGNLATPWHTSWYTTARFGNLKEGTGLLVDLGRTVTATGVTIQLGSTPGANLQVRAGTATGDLHTVASVKNAGGAVRLPLASRPKARYVLIWFTLLPPDSFGTYQADISRVMVTASAQ